MCMTANEKRRLRTRHDNALLREEDLRIALADYKRELDACEPTFEPKKIALLNAQLADLKEQLKEAQRQADEMRVLVRELDIPPNETPHPGGAAAAILARDKHARPTQWDRGGDIADRNSGWDSPVQAKRNRR